MLSGTYTRAEHNAYATGMGHGIQFVAQLLLAARGSNEEQAGRERTDRATRRARWNDPPPYDSPQGEREREREEGPWAAE